MKRIEQRRKWFLVFYIFRFGVLLLCSSLTACTVKTANSDLKIPKVQLERLHGCNAQDTSTYSKCSVRCTHAQWLAFSLSICPLPFRKPKLMEIVYSKWPEDKKNGTISPPTLSEFVQVPTTGLQTGAPGLALHNCHNWHNSHNWHTAKRLLFSTPKAKRLAAASRIKTAWVFMFSLRAKHSCWVLAVAGPLENCKFLNDIPCIWYTSQIRQIPGLVRHC